jgi:trk system potassium uptake protein TrkA
MKIIIIGNGKVGYTLAQQLSSEKHDLTIIDSTPAALQRADSNLDVLCVTGNGASISVLIDAGVRRTDLVIAVTNYDEVNIMCCLIAKKLGAKHTIARIRTPDYYNDAPLLKRETGLDMIINPELSAAQEISRILRFPNASSIESFARGRVEMIGFRLEKGDSLAGIPLYEFNRLHPNRTLLCAVQRGDEVVIPNGSFVPEFGDTGYIIGSPSELSRIFRELGRPMTKIKDVTVIGGSRITIYLAHALEKMDMHMRIIEIDMAKCQMLSEALPHVLVIQGDGTDNDLLESENALTVMTTRETRGMK